MASWQIWALLSAVFAALTAIFAKVGVEQVSPDVATLLRTVVILVAMTLLVLGTRQFPALFTASPRSYAFLLLSGLATGASWWCYFRALQAGRCGARRAARQVERRAGGDFRRGFSWRTARAGQLAGRRARGTRRLVRDAEALTQAPAARATDPATRATRIEQKIPARRVSPSARTIAAAVTRLSALAAGFGRQLRML